VLTVIIALIVVALTVVALVISAQAVIALAVVALAIVRHNTSTPCSTLVGKPVIESGSSPPVVIVVVGDGKDSSALRNHICGTSLICPTSIGKPSLLTSLAILERGAPHRRYPPAGIEYSTPLPNSC